MSEQKDSFSNLEKERSVVIGEDDEGKKASEASGDKAQQTGQMKMENADKL
eukprot:CAMPEP_0174292766 /NCGR_PEP_ID=MMETSP0809-20121228/36464_1 /TAXON_ID=73025 ORGANISM="Eutreptiella gymnastica-like, Strain CCMP1594" /NCGR_SAMPLE_ID=MMETSP0809 /ASSEMBLY_ACC=CAM_ASM_000658 /LENGTH=50 /DNA_ID=CAMNT_0015393051 /DNA_START=179 /DNA_END=328 /DNA_ORIENTATION=-